MTDTLEHFLEPTFEDSRFPDDGHPSDGAEWAGLGVGGLISHRRRSPLAYLMYVRRRGITLGCATASPRVHRFLAHKWYFDELYDAVFVRPFAARRRVRPARGRDRLRAGLRSSGGATGIVRAGTSFARAIQTGYLRAYALLLLLGVAALALYFLISST